MADQFETDHHEDHNQEGWQDSQPPVDTFHDADMNAEGMATVSEESGEQEDYEKGSAESAPAKKNSKLIPLAAGGGLLLVLVAVLFSHFASRPSAPPPTVTASMPPIRPVPPPPISSDMSANNSITVSDDGKPKISPDQAIAPLTDSATASASSTAAAASASTGGTAIPNAAGNPSALMPNPPPASTDTASAQALLSSVGSQPSPTPNPAVPAPATPHQPGQPVPSLASSATSGKSNAELDALSSHVEDLQKSLDQVTQQLSQMSTMMANNQAAPAAAANPELEDRLNKIEQHLAQLDHAPPSLSAPAPAPTTANEGLISPAVNNPTVGSVKPDLPSNELPSKSMRSSHHTRTSKTHLAARSMHHKTVKHKKTKPVDQEEGTVTLAPASGVLEIPHNSAWVLRAATPNEAWVSKNSTSSELTHVRLGDDLPGIGQVQAIHPIGNTWVIEGTEGIVH